MGCGAQSYRLALCWCFFALILGPSGEEMEKQKLKLSAAELGLTLLYTQWTWNKCVI